MAARSRREVKPTPKWVVPAVIGAAIAVAIAICAWVLVQAISTRAREAKKLATIKTGVDAVLKLAEQAKPVAVEYVEFKKAKPKESWTARRLDAKTYEVEGFTVEDAMLLQGGVLLASIREKPQVLKKPTREQTTDPRVEVAVGDYPASEGSVRCLRFRVTLDVATSGEPISLMIIARYPG
jgi:hypothetical protein